MFSIFILSKNPAKWPKIACFPGHIFSNVFLILVIRLQSIWFKTGLTIGTKMNLSNKSYPQFSNFLIQWVNIFQQARDFVLVALENVGKSSLSNTRVGEIWRLHEIRIVQVLYAAQYASTRIILADRHPTCRTHLALLQPNLDASRTKCVQVRAHAWVLDFAKTYLTRDWQCSGHVMALI
jgi:hypothetical protein